MNVNVLPGESLPEANLPLPEGALLVPESGTDAPPNVEMPVPEHPAEPIVVLKAELAQVLQKLQRVSFELAAAVDSYGDHHEKLRDEVAKLGLKLEKHNPRLSPL